MNTNHPEAGKQLRARLLSLIRDAAEAGKSQEVMRLTGLLKRVDRIQAMSRDLTKEMDYVVAELQGGTGPERDTATFPTSRGENRLTSGTHQAEGRERGAAARKDFIRQAESKGVLLKQEGGTVYATDEGNRIALLYSRQHRDRWFFGVHDQDLDAVVFLCGQADPSQVRAYVLPGEEYRANRRLFSHTEIKEKIELKFNVKRTIHGQIELAVPNRPPYNLTRRQDDFAQL